MRDCVRRCPVHPSYDFIDVLASRSSSSAGCGHRGVAMSVTSPSSRSSAGRTSASPRCSTASSASNTAIVCEEAGTTRDRHFARAEWDGRDFWLVDTGGFVDDPQPPDGRRDPPPGRRRRSRKPTCCSSSSTRRWACIPATRASPRCCADGQALAARREQGRRSAIDGLLRVLQARRRRSASGVGGERQGLGRPARRARRATAGRARDGGDERCASPSSAGRTSASRRSSTGCWARSVSSSPRSPARRAMRSTRRCAITVATFIFVDTAGLRRQSEGRRRHRVLLVAAHAARDRARRHLPPDDRRDRGRVHNQDLKIAAPGVGGRARADHRRQQVGPRREGRQEPRQSSRRRPARRRRSSSSCRSCSRRRSPASA